MCGRSGLASHPCLLTLHSAARPRLPPGGAPAPGNLVSTDTCKPGEQGGLAAGLRPTSRVPPALRTAQSPDAGAGRTLPGAAPFANHSSRSRLRPVKPGEAAPPRGPAEDSEATPLRQGRAPHSGLLPPETEQLCGRTLAGSASNQHAECGDPAPGRRLLPAVLRSAARPRRAPRGGETWPSGRGLPWKRRNAISRAFQRQLTRQHSCPVSLDSLRQQLIKHVSESKVTPIWCGPDIRLLEFF